MFCWSLSCTRLCSSVIDYLCIKGSTYCTILCIVLTVMMLYHYKLNTCHAKLTFATEMLMFDSSSGSLQRNRDMNLEITSTRLCIYVYMYFLHIDTSFMYYVAQLLFQNDYSLYK